MDKVEEVKRLISEETKDKFQKRVFEQSEKLNEWLKGEKYDNSGFSVGLELEAYVTNPKNQVTKIPADIKKNECFAPELGVQNLELNTSPHSLNKEGLVEQEEDLKNRFLNSRSSLGKKKLSIALDSLSTNYRDPNGFFRDTEVKEGLVFAKNMSEAPRYYGLDNAVLNRKNGFINFNVPGVDLEFPSLLFESLATSLQVHLQIPDTKSFLKYYNTSMRTMAPLLALSANSVFLPPEFYRNGLPQNVFHEMRIPIFEQSVNPSDEYEKKKVRFPSHLESFEDLTQKIAKDDPYTACLREWKKTNGPQKEFWEWNYKLREFWRWQRPVIGGKPIEKCCSNNSIRIEYRPLPTQPTLKDNISLQFVTSGLIHGLIEKNHPIIYLEWEKSKNDFYRAAKNGLNAELHWVNQAGEKTKNKDVLFKELFKYAEIGLKKIGLNHPKTYLDPIKTRWTKKITPSIWKKKKVYEKTKNGLNYDEAIRNMKKEYTNLSFKKKEFVNWN
ncbi:hypothetical protein C9439_02350 [archaeon SCG-AAA382B04]|nr:hypothetical protein C9439_02350 [archaeon SCG-AAA382B04]